MSPLRSIRTLVAIALLLAAGGLLLSRSSQPAHAATGCDPARPHDAGDLLQTITSGGETREYLLHVPPSYTGEDALPLVLNFHGLGSNWEQQADYSGLPAKADEEGFLLAMPQGLVTDTIAVPHWNNTRLEERPDDILFVSDLLDHLETELCVDTARVFSTGMSMGGMISSRLACDLADRFAAVAPVAGLYYPPLAVELPDEPGCEAARAVPIIAFHGTEDPIVSYGGGGPTLEDFPFPLSFRSMEDEILPDWAANQRCDTTPSRETVSEHVDLIRYDGCQDGSVIELYVVAGGGHTWPGAASDLLPDTLGATTQEINADDLMWAFFQAHPLANAPAAPTPPAQLPETGVPDDGGGGSNAVWLIAIAAAAAVTVAGGGLWLVRRR